MKAPRESDRDDAPSLAEAVRLELNQRWGGQATDDAGQDLSMAGFTRHGPVKKSALTVILEALGALCMKTLARLKSLRLASDQDAEKLALARQSALKTAQSAAKFISDMEAQVYRRHAAQFIGLTPDQVDLEVAKKMLKERQSPGQVKAALRSSPGLANRHPDAKQHVEDVVNKARKALDASAP